MVHIFLDSSLSGHEYDMIEEYSPLYQKHSFIFLFATFVDNDEYLKTSESFETETAEFYI